MKPEEEIVTAKITKRELERIAAQRWLKPRLQKMMWWMVLGMGAGFILLAADTFGMPKDAHRIGAYALYLAMLLLLGGFSWPYYVATIKADRIGKDEAKKLIV